MIRRYIGNGSLLSESSFPYGPPHAAGEAAKKTASDLFQDRSEAVFSFSAVLLRMPADRLKGLLAQVVLDLAGVLPGGLRAHAQAGQQLGKKLVPFVHALGDLPSRLQQYDHPRLIQRDISAFPQALGGIAHTGLGHTDFLRHVDGPDVAVLLLQHEHCLQIVLCRFVYRHSHHLCSRIAPARKKCKEKRMYEVSH